MDACCRPFKQNLQIKRQRMSIINANGSRKVTFVELVLVQERACDDQHQNTSRCNDSREFIRQNG
jgi:hypothetical protein